MAEDTYDILEYAPKSASPQNERSYNPIAKGLTNFLESGAESAAGIADFLNIKPLLADTALRSLGQDTPERETYKNQVISGAEKIFPEGYLTQEGKGTRSENFIRNAGSAIPGAAAAILSGGAAAAPVLRGAVGAALAETGADEFGAGPLVKALAGFGGSLGTEKAVNLFKRFMGKESTDLVGMATKAATENYEKESKLGQKVFGKAGNYDDRLAALEKEVKSARNISNEQREQLLSNIKLTRSTDVKSVPGPRFYNKETSKYEQKYRDIINGSDLAKSKKQNNELFNNKLFRGSENESARNYLYDLNEIVKEEGKSLGKNNPEWLSAWNEGDEIWSALKYGQNIPSVISDKASKIVKNPLAITILGPLGFGSYLFPEAAAGFGALTGLGLGAAQAGGYIAKFAQKPSTQKILKQVLSATVNESTPQILKAFNRLNQNANEFQKDNPINNKSEELYDILETK